MKRGGESAEVGVRVGVGGGKKPPISRAGFETRSENRLMLAAHHFVECLAMAGPVVLADFNFSISRNVSERNFPGGTSSVSGP